MHVTMESALTGAPVRFAHNARWQSGMGSSIAAGVSALSPNTAGAFVVPGDMDSQSRCCAT
jgi:CTP:molybdopterin cytidylyltransferase MocA